MCVCMCNYVYVDIYVGTYLKKAPQYSTVAANTTTNNRASLRNSK